MYLYLYMYMYITHRQTGRHTLSHTDTHTQTHTHTHTETHIKYVQRHTHSRKYSLELERLNTANLLDLIHIYIDTEVRIILVNVLAHWYWSFFFWRFWPGDVCQDLWRSADCNASRRDMGRNRYKSNKKKRLLVATLDTTCINSEKKTTSVGPLNIKCTTV